jgi:hypothetical protein
MKQDLVGLLNTEDTGYFFLLLVLSNCLWVCLEFIIIYSF